MSAFFRAGRAGELDDLRCLDLFSGVDDDELRALAENMVEIHVPGRQTVISEGQPGRLFFIVTGGTFSAFRGRPGQPVVPPQPLRPGDFFGELSVVGDQGRYGLSVRTESGGRLLQISRSTLDAFLESRPVIRLKLQGVAARRHSRTVAETLELGRRKEVRILCRRRVTIELDDGQRRPMELENLSLGGVCLGPAPSGWRPGCQVRFGLMAARSALPLRGEVRWRHDDTVGIAFRAQDEHHDKLLQIAIRLLLETAG